MDDKENLLLSSYIFKPIIKIAKMDPAVVFGTMWSFTKGGRNEMFLTHKYGAELFGYSERTVIRYLQKLEKAGLIVKRKSSAQEHFRGFYRINFRHPAVQEINRWWVNSDIGKRSPIKDPRMPSDSAAPDVNYPESATDVIPWVDEFKAEHKGQFPDCDKWDSFLEAESFFYTVALEYEWIHKGEPIIHPKAFLQSWLLKKLQGFQPKK